MEPVTAQSSVPATGSAETAVGTCTAAALSASAANQRRSTQRRSPRDPSPRTRALVTGFVPAAALSSTLPRPSHHPKPPATTSLHPPPTTHKSTTSDYVPTCHHLPQLPPPTTGVLLPMQHPKADGCGAVRRLDGRPARGLRPRSTERPEEEPGAPELGAAWPRNTHTDVRALALALAPHFALPVPGA